MSDDKPKPVDDLKEGLGLLFRAAKGAVEKLPPPPTDKLGGVAKDIEHLTKDAAKEVGRAFESIGNEIDKAFGKSGPGVAAEKAANAARPPSTPPPEASANAAPPAPPEPPKEEPKYDDGYAPEPPRGPRVG